MKSVDGYRPMAQTKKCTGRETFVKTKIELSKLQVGDRLEVLLTEGEPLDNVPKSATEQGYKVLDIQHVKDKVHKITIEK